MDLLLMAYSACFDSTLDHEPSWWHCPQQMGPSNINKENAPQDCSHASLMGAFVFQLMFPLPK